MRRTEAGLVRVLLFSFRWSDQVVTIPNVFVAGEAEEVIGDATAGCGQLNLFGVGLTNTC
jgi:hypothetical protein